jgi:predicted PhzF superfamily epimerase YddE/YHI9
MRKRLAIHQVDAFSGRVFGGNPAAVVLLEEWLPEATMQSIAAENNLAETAFVIPRPDVSPLRWFTPSIEVDLCGHATLGTAYVLFEHRFPSAARLTFSTASGDLAVEREGDLLHLDFPSRPGLPITITDELVAKLGVRPREVLAARDLLVVLDAEADVRAFRPDFPAIASLDAFALIVSAPGDAVDFVSRFFAPRAGVPEDPVTGSAHCTLIPYWAARLGRSTLSAQQLSARGGELVCELRGERVRIGGRVAPYLTGEIEVPLP